MICEHVSSDDGPFLPRPCDHCDALIMSNDDCVPSVDEEGDSWCVTCTNALLLEWGWEPIPQDIS